MSGKRRGKQNELHTATFTDEELDVILRGLTFALDIGEDTYFAFCPDADDYSDGDQEKDEKARQIAQALRERWGQSHTRQRRREC